MHPYQEYIEKLETEYNRSVEELVRGYYIDLDKGPAVIGRDLGIPRTAVLHFISEYNLRPIKLEKLKRGRKSKLETTTCSM